LLHETHPNAEVCTVEFDHDTASGNADTPAEFYHCRVVQEDGELAVCSPVWVG
jgi:hypothetical protein